MNPGCEGKQGFDSRRLAEDVAGRSRRNGSPHCAVYRCSRCWQWHIGSSLSRQRVRSAAR